MSKKKTDWIKYVASDTKKYNKMSKKNKLKNFVIICCVWVFFLVGFIVVKNTDNPLNEKGYRFDTSITGDYAVHFIDVGQGDSALIEFPDDKVMLIDTGENDDEIASTLINYIDNLNITTIDYLVLTHTDSDHIGNAPDIFENYDVLNVYIPCVYSTYEEENNLMTQDFVVKDTKIWRQTMEAIYNEDCLIEMNYSLKGDKIVNEEYAYEVNFYTPLEENLGSSDWNSYSPIMMVNIQNMKYLFVGDAGIEDEETFLQAYPKEVRKLIFDCNVLKVGHHGSKTSTSAEFLDAVKPEIAVISVGAVNDYGHPTQEALDRLEETGCQIMMTKDLGNIVLTSKDGEISQYYVNSPVIDYYEYFYYGFIITCVLLVLRGAILYKQYKKEKDKKKD